MHTVGMHRNFPKTIKKYFKTTESLVVRTGVSPLYCMFGQSKTGIFLKFANHDKNDINRFVLKIQDVSSNKIVI